MINQNELGKAIKLARLLRRLTQQELAEKLQTDPANIVRIEKGRVFPSLKLIHKFEEILDIEIVCLNPDLLEFIKTK